MMKKIIMSFALICTTLTLAGQDIGRVLQDGDTKALEAFVLENDIDGKHIGDRYTLLCAAIKIEDETIVAFLIKHKAGLEVESNGKTPLMYAAKYGQLAIARLLIESGADKETKNERGVTALDYAKRYKQEELVKFLSGK